MLFSTPFEVRAANRDCLRTKTARVRLAMPGGNPENIYHGVATMRHKDECPRMPTFRPGFLSEPLKLS